MQQAPRGFRHQTFPLPPVPPPADPSRGAPLPDNAGVRCRHSDGSRAPPSNFFFSFQFFTKNILAVRRAHQEPAKISKCVFASPLFSADTGPCPGGLEFQALAGLRRAPGTIPGRSPRRGAWASVRVPERGVPRKVSLGNKCWVKQIPLLQKF